MEKIISTIKEKMKKKKKEKGISIISLVITIIVLLILSAIVFVTSLKTLEEADYSKYVSNVSDVSVAFTEKSTAVNGDKAVERNEKHIEQVYNYVAKNGSGENDFLTRRDVPRYTIIKDAGQIGIELPKIIVESGTGKRVPLKYATTAKGKIFTWPPYDYDNKFYITDKDTVEHKMQSQIMVGEEIFEIKIDSGDGTLLDWPEPVYEEESGDTPEGHVHDFSSKTQTDEYFYSEATCLMPAQYYYKCTSCEAKGSTTYVVGTALGHLWGEETLVKEPNCTEQGTVQSTCSRCGTFLNIDVPINSSKHHGGEKAEITQEATCTQEGIKTYKCSSCNATLRTEHIDALEHNMERITITKEATCTEKGIRTYRCSNCGKEMRTEEIAALDHNYGTFEITKEATCKEKGIRTKTCSRCNDTITEEIPIDTSRHYGNEETKTIEEATCLDDGKFEKICSLCKATLSTGSIAALGHAWSAPQPPRKCTRCGLEENLTPQAIYTSADKTLTFIKEFTIYKVGDTFNGKTVAGAYKGIENENYSRGWDSISGDIVSVVFRDEIKPKTTSKWFYGLANCTSMNIANLNTEDVTDMSYMFRNCSKLTTLDISNLDTSNVSNMYAMFKDCNLITSLDVSNFTTNKVTNIMAMFENCSAVKNLM